MARIAGINLPNHKHVVIGLTAIYGIGRPTARKICDAAGVDGATKVQNLDDAQAEKIRAQITRHEVEGDLRRAVAMNIKRLMDLGAYRGLPVNGQRTKTNARTRKGPRRAIKK